MDETISWIKEKEQLMASDDFGRDLASVQALLRKHEGLERDLAALEDKVRLSMSTNSLFVSHNTDLPFTFIHLFFYCLIYVHLICYGDVQQNVQAFYSHSVCLI